MVCPGAGCRGGGKALVRGAAGLAQLAALFLEVEGGRQMACPGVGCWVGMVPQAPQFQAWGSLGSEGVLLAAPSNHNGQGASARCPPAPLSAQ